MKKLISIILSIVLVISCIGNAFIMPISAEAAYKSVTAECFDNDYDITKAYGEGVSLLGEGEFGSSGPKSGEHSVKFGEMGTTSPKAYVPIYANDRQKAYVEQGKTYRISLYMTAQKNGAFYIAYANDESLTFAGTEKTAWIFNSNDTAAVVNKGWQKLETTFTAAQSGYIWVGKESNTLACWIDNVVLCEDGTSTITFMDGENTLNTLSGNSGDLIGTLPVPTAEGKTFSNWCTDAELTNNFSEKYYPVGNVTLYAKWNDGTVIAEDFENYTVDSNWNSEAVIATDETSGNKSLYFAKAAETNDYAFIYNNDNIVNAYVEQGKNYRLYFKINVVNQVGGVWYGISNSATDFSSVTTYLMYGSSDTTGTGQWRGKGWTEVCFEFTAAKSGYVFIGKNSGTLNAYFDDIRLALANTTTITFQTNNDSVVVDAKTGNAGTELGALTSPSVPGMRFEGWYSDEDLTKPFVSAYYPNYSKTLYAKWSRYVVTAECFDDNYDITKAYGEDVFLLGDGEFGSSGPYSGEHSVKFGEYGTESAKAYVPIYANDRQKAYVEQGKTYRISLYMTAQKNGAFYIAYANDESLTFAGTEKTAWIFNSNDTAAVVNKGWQKLETTFTAAQSGYIWVGKESNTLACWVDNVVLCEVGSSTLTFMDGETTVATLSGNTGDLIGALPVPESSVSGMILTGWYMDADCTTEFTDTYFATGDLTLYAKWERYVVTAECFDDNYDITKAYGEDVFLLGDGEFGSSGPKSGEHSVKFVENMNSSKAYVPIYANNRQKAYVEKGKTYYISMYMTVQKNGAFYIGYANDDSLNFKGTEKVKYIFGSSATFEIWNKGWQKLETTFTAEETGYIWVGKESNSNTNTLTCWIDNVVLCEATTPAITLMDGTTVINTITVNAGDEVNIPKQQATFDEVIGKWYLDADCTVEYKDAYYPTYDLTLYAKWEKNSAIVTAYNNSAALRVGANSSTGKNGLRIYNSIDVSRMENANIVEFGSIATMESTFEGEELTIDMKGTKGIGVGVAYSEEKGISTFWDTTDNYIYFTSYLTGIKPEYYGENFIIRTYAIDADGKVYYGDVASVCVFEVAHSIDLSNSVDGTAPTDADIAAFNAFAGGNNGDFTMYDNWLKTSELAFAGKLRNLAKTEDTLSGEELTTALEIEGYYEPFFERAIANVGNRAMLKAMFEKAARGEDITIVGFGGSITRGAACADERDSYTYLVAAWLREQFPGITVNWHNAGIGATTSVLGIGRMNDHVLAYNPDLVILDFSANDQLDDFYSGSYEAILRTLYENQIAVVTIAFGNVNNNEYTNQGVYHKGRNSEDLHGPVMLYNDVPVIDYYGVMWDCYLDADGDGYNIESDAAHWNTLWADYIHPTEAGHKLAANAINYYLGKVLADVENITETVTYPAVPYNKYTENFMGAMMYGDANVGSLLTDSNNYTVGEYKNYDSTTVSNWTTWQLEENGYVEFTIEKCKMFALMSVNNPDAPKAEIYVNDEKVATHTAYRESGELNWMNYINFFDGNDTVKVKVKCVSGTYRITSVLIAK